MLDYLDFCEAVVDARLAEVDLEAESGFEWLPFGKLELQIYNIRHIMMHAGELAARLGERGTEIRCVGMRSV